MENRKLNISIIAVHAGAGYHSTLKEKDYKLLCSTACKKVMIKLKDGGSALDAVTLAIQCLEDSQMTNAGVGSSLTLEGTVECDASLMDGKSLLFGGVGALSNVKNPIMVAKKLLDSQKDGLLPLGRIPPCIMVGKGAYTWATEHGIEPVSDVSLKSESSIKTYKNHKRRLDEAENRMERKRRKYLESKPRNDAISDTVGAVCIDMCGNIAAGASSGGISLKQSGRLGPAALYGTGCWAYNHRGAKKPGVAVATSGTGEHIIKTLLAKTCADLLQSEDCPTTAMQTTLQDHFLDSDILDQTTGRYGGVLALKHYVDDDTGQTEGKEDTQDHIVELLWGHTTDSMCIGYMSSSQSRPKISKIAVLNMLLLLSISVGLTLGDSPSVNTPVGTIIGTTEDVVLDGVTHRINKFLGIRFGESTAGNNRLRKPVPAAPFTTPYQATSFGANCPQVRVPEEIYPVNQSEDCLFLNIYAPSTGTNHAVMFWIYGGGFNVGSSDIYQGHNLVPFGDVILVVINYRVGFFGFYTTGDQNAPGNMAFWDQQLALKWVHDNIGAFGGDNTRVTVFGESAGAVSSIYHAMYPPNKGYLQRVISESGSPSLMTDFTHYPLQTARDFAQKIGCDSQDTSQIVECLRQKSLNELMTTISTTYSFFFPTIDHDFVRIHPTYLPVLAQMDPSIPEVEFFRSIDVINGFNKYEGGIYLYYIPIDDPETFMPTDENFAELITALFAFVNKPNVKESVLDVVKAEYTDWSNTSDPLLQRKRFTDLAGDITFASTDMQYNRLHANTSDQSVNTYVYNFLPVPSTRTIRAPSWMDGANHAEEMGYVFGLDKRLNGENYNGVPQQWELELHREMMTYWTNFAKTGNPNSPLPPKVTWPKYTAEMQEAILLDKITRKQKYFYAKQVQFWLDVLPGMMDYMDKKDGTCSV